ncbi:MAG: type IV secretion system DNA-binding domain-containing protein, partial [Patescibacteria group bacterium]
MNILLFLLLAVAIISPIYLYVTFRQTQEKRRKEEWEEGIKYTLIRIDVPKNNDKAPLASEQMFASIHGIYSEASKSQYRLSFEIVAKDKYIQFYVYTPVQLKDFIEGQIYAQYPTVEISEVSDYVKDVHKENINFADCTLSMNKPDVYPIKLFSDFEVDPLSGITSVMSNLNTNEQVWLQLVIKPVGDEWQEKGNNIISAVRSGKATTATGIATKIINTIGNFFKLLLVQAVRPGAEVEEPPKEVKLPGTVEDALKGIEYKIMKLGYETNIRIQALANDPVTAKLKCQNIAATFKQYNTTNHNGFKIGEIDINKQDSWEDYRNRTIRETSNILNISELASIFHLPHETVTTPNIVWSGSKKGEPPSNLPMNDNTSVEDLTILGETNFRNSFKLFGIKRDDRKRHIYIVGKSGTGKSTLIENMALDDMTEGRGLIVVDPHGELGDKVLSCVPDERVNDVVVFDPADRAYPIAFNLLEAVDDDFKGMVASGFVGIFKKIFGDSWGPRLEHILRNTVLALLDFPESTMLDIPKMLTNQRFRTTVIEKVKDPVIKEFWVNEFESYDAKFRTEAVSPILNKVGQFLATSTIRNIVGQAHSKINIREIMDQKKIMVVNLSRGKIGEDNSALLGAMMITKIQLAAMSRADVTIDKRPECYLYVDEFQNFATDSFAVILSEARKYNLCLTMANQYIDQMPEEVRSAVFGNAGSIVSFRVGGNDADFLVKEFEPVFEANDLVNLDKYQIYIKLLIDGISSPAFSARTLPPVDKITGNGEAVINQSR